MSVYTNNQVGSALLISSIAFLLNLPQTYKLTNRIFGSVVPTTNALGTPTLAGVGIHALVLFVILIIYFKSFNKELRNLKNVVENI